MLSNVSFYSAFVSWSKEQMTLFKTLVVKLGTEPQLYSHRRSENIWFAKHLCSYTRHHHRDWQSERKIDPSAKKRSLGMNLNS